MLFYSSSRKLNREKYKFRQPPDCFLGQTLSKAGIQPDKEKVEAIQKL
jgi:hypothetical protein